MTKLLSSIALLLATQQACSFSIIQLASSPATFTAISHPPITIVFSSSEGSTGNNAEEEEEQPRLILDPATVNAEMGQFKSKYPTSEADYLAAARKRAEQKLESVNNMSTDEEWKAAASEKKNQMGGAMEDEWEASLKEAGNIDSQILIPMDLDAGGDGDDSEPKLLL